MGMIGKDRWSCLGIGRRRSASAVASHDSLTATHDSDIYFNWDDMFSRVHPYLSRASHEDVVPCYICSTFFLMMISFPSLSFYTPFPSLLLFLLLNASESPMMMWDPSIDQVMDERRRVFFYFFAPREGKECE